MSLTQCVNSQHLEIMRESLDRKLQDRNGIVISPDRQLKELFCRYLKTTALKVIKVGSRAPMKMDEVDERFPEKCIELSHLRMGGDTMHYFTLATAWGRVTF